MDGKWFTAADNVEDTNYTVDDLNTGDEYLFRVFAVGAGGTSEASAPSDPVLVEGEFLGNPQL